MKPFQLAKQDLQWLSSKDSEDHQQRAVTRTVGNFPIYKRITCFLIIIYYILVNYGYVYLANFLRVLVGSLIAVEQDVVSRVHRRILDVEFLPLPTDFDALPN